MVLMLLPSIFGSSTCTIGSNGCGLNSITLNSIAVNSIGKTGKPVYMVLAFANGCTHCEALNDYIRNLSGTYDIRMTYINAVTNQTALTRYFSYYKVPTDNWDTVPILFVKNAYCVGDTQCESFLSANMAAFAKNGTQPIEVSGSGLGSLTVAELTGLALVDSVNPCAFAVLIFLLSTLFMRNPDKRHRILLGGIAFALGIFAFYITVGILLVLGIRSVLAVSNLNSVYVYGAFGVFAIILGILNIKDYVAHGKFGFAMEVPKRWRPKMLGTMDKILFEFASIPASFIAGVVVTAFLLPCITGPYFVAGSLLRNLPTGAAILWLAYYNFLFILPMLIITALVYMSFTTVEKAHAFRERNIERLHLLAGLMLLIVGIVILLQIIR
jgi:thiol-disulfide isomerase/thioredoxin